ncbi:unnamed protein product [Parascedosporium putredinis]|uniref:Rhodopsin domain-containing protein n=1 Tax=Parascedosporium putredinis TaxID=1442378 RepID=A0A9P1HBG9_9PEZI|nr:unnamed protein product [Parascedosporium putredinis]CAI8003908.1 unnamed protein product [Parascedosporium putredinis]
MSFDAPGAAVLPRYLPVSELATTSLQQSAIAIIFTFNALAFVVYLLRMYSRISTKQVGVDDYLITGAMICSIGLLVPTYMFFRYEYIGFRTSDVPDTYDAEPVLMWNWIMQVLYNPILALVKSSILFFLLRLGGHRQSIRWCIIVLNTFNLAMMVAVFLGVIFQTMPVRAYWDHSITPKYTIDGVAFYISTAIITIITDFLVLFLPFLIFLGLKMRLAAKIGLMMVFLTGGVVTAVGIVRVHELRKKFNNIDPGYDSRHGVGDTLSTVERWLPGLFTNDSSRDRNYGYTGTGPGATRNDYGMGTSRTRRTQTRRGSLTEINLDNLKRSAHTEIRGHSPDGSEEEIMTYNGIIRTTNIRVSYNDASDPEGNGQGRFAEGSGAMDSDVKPPKNPV